MCSAWMVIPFIPSSNLFFRVGFVIAERSLYLSSAGLCLFVATGLARVYSIKTYRMVRIVNMLLSVNLCVVAVLCFSDTSTDCLHCQIIAHKFAAAVSRSSLQ